MAQQTAVEWLVNRWKKLQSKGEKMSWQQIIDITELAKEMDKEEIIEAKWQQEKMYSEDEVLKLLINFSDDRTFLKEDVAIQWFEQFKKQ